MLADLLRDSRSIRRFQEKEPVSETTLRALVDLTRYCPSAANRQPLKFLLSHSPEKNARIFSTLAWAGYLPDWPGPPPGERPAAYIVILGDTAISRDFGVDHGIAAQTIMLGAREQGLGGCMVGSIRKDRLRELLGLPERYEILLTLALGRPRETVVLADVAADGDIRYWRDDAGIHHVPKRRLDDLILAF